MAMFVCIFTEFDPIDAPKLNEKVLKDKRKKLRETFTRVYRLYVSILYVQIITVHSTFSNPSTSVGRLSPQLLVLRYQFPSWVATYQSHYGASCSLFGQN